MMYAWATKEYLLWHMSLGQVVMYHNLGMDIKYPEPEKGHDYSAKNMSPAEIGKLREELRKTFGAIDG